MPLRTLSRLAAGAALVLLVSSNALAQTPSKTVLTIHWGDENFPITHDLDAAIRRAVTSDGNRPVFYYAEYLESETFPSESATLAFRDYLRGKFDGRHIDVVITVATPALEFALRHRAELFPDAPIAFVAGSIRSVTEAMRSARGVTGVLSDPTFGETVQLALTLHPSVKRLFVVAQSPTIEDYDDRVRSALSRFSSEVEIIYNTERTLSGLVMAVKNLPPQSVILFTRYMPENTGRIVYSDEVLRRMVEVSPAPIYSSAELYLGTGVVGGMMRSSEMDGTRVGQIARRILEGARPEDIPIEAVEVVPTFDWRAVRRWGIDPARLPSGSEIRFHNLTVWESYRGYIIGALVVLVGQLFLIAALLTQQARRRRAEETIRAREATVRTSYERIRQMAGRLINAQEAARASLARDLHDDVCQQLVYVSMSVNSLKHSSGRIQDAETQEAFTKLENETNSMFDGIRRLSHELHPSTLPLLGLAPTLKAHCTEVEKRHDVQVSFKAEGEIRQLPSDVAVCLFRIAQEALRNAIAHGEAHRLAVSLVASGGQVELTVTDDGRGFDVEAARRGGKGLGLVSMVERAHIVGAEVEIVSGARKGTVIRVRRSSEEAEDSPPGEASLLARPENRRATGGRLS